MPECNRRDVITTIFVCFTMYKMLYILPMILNQLEEVNTGGIIVSMFQMAILSFRKVTGLIRSQITVSRSQEFWVCFLALLNIFAQALCILSSIIHVYSCYSC